MSRWFEPVETKEVSRPSSETVVYTQYWDQPSGVSTTWIYTVPASRKWRVRYIRALFQVDVADAPYMALAFNRAGVPTHNINGQITRTLWGDSTDDIALTNDNEQACIQWSRGGRYITYGTATIKTEQRYLPEVALCEGENLTVYTAGFVNVGTGLWLTITIDEERV